MLRRPLPIHTIGGYHRGKQLLLAELGENRMAIASLSLEELLELVSHDKLEQLLRESAAAAASQGNWSKVQKIAEFVTNQLQPAPSEVEGAETQQNSQLVTQSGQTTDSTPNGSVEMNFSASTFGREPDVITGDEG
jgi:hypothetical protein